jgi:hypothetical protein
MTSNSCIQITFKNQKRLEALFNGITTTTFNPKNVYARKNKIMRA